LKVRDVEGALPFKYNRSFLVAQELKPKMSKAPKIREIYVLIFTAVLVWIANITFLIFL
jgi:hypothetical protein